MAKHCLSMVGQSRKIDIIIPCAGMGTRLLHLTKKKTKNMVKINGFSILEHQVYKFLKLKNKINKIHFILGYKSSVLKKYILGLNLPFKAQFHVNKKFKTTGCAYSFFSAIKYLKKDSIILNSDLILSETKISKLFYKKKNFLYLRSPKHGTKSRAVKAKIKKKKIIKIDIMKKNYNYDVVGPFRLSFESINKLKKIKKTINFNEFSKMSCYSFFGKLTNLTRLNYEILKDNEWYEINNLNEYKKSFKHKIFDIKNYKNFN